jgi:hypothetical protein
MYDIEVIDGRNYAIICEDSSAHRFLKAMNSKLLMKKLSSEPGEEIFLTVQEVAPLCKGFKIESLNRLISIGLIEYRHFWQDKRPVNDSFYKSTYHFTDFGLEIMKDLKEVGGDIEILIS